MILMGESIGPEIVSAFNQAAGLSTPQSFLVFGVLSEKQKELHDQCRQTPTAKVLMQPLTLRNLRKEIHRQFQAHKQDLADSVGKPKK